MHAFWIKRHLKNIIAVFLLFYSLLIRIFSIIVLNRMLYKNYFTFIVISYLFNQNLAFEQKRNPKLPGAQVESRGKNKDKGNIIVNSRHNNFRDRCVFCLFNLQEPINVVRKSQSFMQRWHYFGICFVYFTLHVGAIGDVWEWYYCLLREVLPQDWLFFLFQCLEIIMSTVIFSGMDMFIVSGSSDRNAHLCCRL
jgi:hypothetical protein